MALPCPGRESVAYLRVKSLGGWLQAQLDPGARTMSPGSLLSTSGRCPLPGGSGQPTSQGGPGSPGFTSSEAVLPARVANVWVGPAGVALSQVLRGGCA